MSRLYLLLCLAGTIAACAASPPRSNPWADKAITVEPAARPVALPSWPEATPCGGNLCLTPEQADSLLRFAGVADENYTVAIELSAAVDEMKVSHNSLVRAGDAEFELSELRATALDAERRGRLWDKFSYWALLALVGIGAAK